MTQSMGSMPAPGKLQGVNLGSEPAENESDVRKSPSKNTSLPRLKNHNLLGKGGIISEFNDDHSHGDGDHSRKKSGDVNSDNLNAVLGKIDTKVDHLETFNPVETSKKILLKCNVIKEKNPKVREIHPGEGHLISTLDKSIGEVYRDIYHRPIVYS